MEVYKSEAREIVERFLDRRISFPDCIAALDAALAGVLPRLSAEELPQLRELMLANNEIVMKEMERRGRRRKAAAPANYDPPPPPPAPATRTTPATMDKIRQRLQQELMVATERAAKASAAFIAVTSQVPSGLPHPDGTQRIRNISHELAFARTELMRAHSRLDAFLVSGASPDDVPNGDD